MDTNAPKPPIPQHAFDQSRLLPGYERDWPKYFDAVKDQPPRDTLLRALQEINRGNAGQSTVRWFAIDLACGEGRDTRAILAANSTANILAIDNSVEALARLRSKLSYADSLRVSSSLLPMESVPHHNIARPNTAMLINASFALPFCHEDHFPSLWNWITTTLAPGGYFSGQIFGDRDDWAPDNPRRHFTREQVNALLAPFNIIHLEEVEKDGKDAMGGMKHYHLYHIVASKRSP